jgi:hypothetical protein
VGGVWEWNKGPFSSNSLGIQWSGKQWSHTGPGILGQGLLPTLASSRNSALWQGYPPPAEVTSKGLKEAAPSVPYLCLFSFFGIRLSEANANTGKIRKWPRPQGKVWTQPWEDLRFKPGADPGKQQMLGWERTWLTELPHLIDLFHLPCFHQQQITSHTKKQERMAHSEKKKNQKISLKRPVGVLFDQDLC